jgi:histidinol-phosphate aminotransferase
MGEDLEFDFDGLVNIADSSTALCFVTSPDNPSGRTATAGELETLARTLPAQCMLVVDEAYIEFTGDEAAHSLLPRLDEFENLIITRTFSKCYGLAGLRLGYGIMPPWLADLLQRVKQPFSVNIMAETGVLAALKDPHFIEQTVRTVAQGREYLTNELEALGCSVLPSKANFLLIRLPEDRMKTADMVFEELLERGIIIRPLTSYRMPDALRVSVGNPEENREFMRALREILA